jgi:hypothetical protein
MVGPGEPFVSYGKKVKLKGLTQTTVQADMQRAIRAGDGPEMRRPGAGAVCLPCAPSSFFVVISD